MNTPKKIAITIVAGLFVYLSIFTWNLRTGYLDALSNYTGMDVSGFIIRPGLWVSEQITGFWSRYVYLVGLKQENDQLQERMEELQRENMIMSSQARSAERLERLLEFTPPDSWDFSGAQVIAHRMGPAASLATLTINRGGSSGVKADMPVVCMGGVVGRVLDTGATVSSVLLLNDPNSRIAVLGADNRSPGMLAGQGYGKNLLVRYVNLNAIIDPGEMLLTSGLSGIFPKGLPVARVVKVQRSDISLFLTVLAEPLVDVSCLEEVLLLDRLPVADAAADAPVEPDTTPEEANHASDQ